MKRWNRISCIALVLAAFSHMQVARAEAAANAFVVVEAESVRIGDGDVIHFANATSATPVRVTARTGWRVNGQKEISFVRAANESGSLHLVSVLGEDETHIPYEDCEFDYTVATNHVLAPQITASASPAQQTALYALPETGADASVSANVSLLQKGEHEIVTTWKPCPRCGATRSPSEERRRVSSSPLAYAWTATAGGVAMNSSTWTGRLSKGIGQKVSFAVVGSNGCSQCECRASTAAAVDVCEVSIDRPDFIGLDRTDAGWANPTIYSAAVNLDPEPSATISYDWRDCGICSFTGRTDQARVRYFAPDPDRASASFLAEPLTVAVGVGDSASTTCTTNFTVVKARMVTPSGDPVSRPVSSGLGQNEFTYSDVSPGVLSMNLVAEIEPDEVAELFSAEFRFVVDSIDGSEQTWAATNSDGAAVVGFGMLLATVLFRGMPAHNSAFGKKKAALLFRGAQCDETDYEVFFPKAARNHPACSTCVNCPNWFYYWREGDVCSIPSDAKYEQRAGLYGSWNPSAGKMALSDLAAQSAGERYTLTANVFVTNYVYAIDHHVATSLLLDVSANSCGKTGEVYFVKKTTRATSELRRTIEIGGTGRGIRCAALVVQHELCHKDYAEMLARHERMIEDCADSLVPIGETFGWDSFEFAVAKKRELECRFEHGDLDAGTGDGVLDSSERKGDGGVYSNDFEPDTYGLAREISPDYGSYGEEEVRARKCESEDLSSLYHPENDWANPGCQSKEAFGPE